MCRFFAGTGKPLVRLRRYLGLMWVAELLRMIATAARQLGWTALAIAGSPLFHVDGFPLVRRAVVANSEPDFRDPVDVVATIAASVSDLFSRRFSFDRSLCRLCVDTVGRHVVQLLGQTKTSSVITWPRKFSICYFAYEFSVNNL